MVSRTRDDVVNALMRQLYLDKAFDSLFRQTSKYGLPEWLMQKMWDESDHWSRLSIASKDLADTFTSSDLPMHESDYVQIIRVCVRFGGPGQTLPSRIVSLVKASPAAQKGVLGELYDAVMGTDPGVPRFVEMLARAGLLDDGGATDALIAAVHMGNCRVARLLIDGGAGVNMQTTEGLVPLHQACLDAVGVAVTVNTEGT